MVWLPWFASYTQSAAQLGLDPLEDQQLGGLVMWVPGGLVYMLAGIGTAASAIGLRPLTRQ